MRTKILYIETSTSDVIGGSFFSLLELVRGLDKNKYSPFVLFYENNQLAQDFINAGAKVFYFINEDHNDKARNLLKTENSYTPRLAWNILEAVGIAPTIRIFRGIKRQEGFANIAESIVTKNEISLIHINDGLTPGLPFIRIAKKYNLPIIVHERKIRDYAKIERIFVKHVQYMICTSNAVKDNFIRQFPDFDKVVTIYNPISSDISVDERKKASLINELAISEKSPIICQVSNLIARKGQDTLIKALKILKQKIENITLLIVGGVPALENNYANKLKSMIQSYDLDQNVRFFGFKEDRELFLDLADIVVHVPNLPESFGRIVLEAMQLGKPVISSNTGGTAELIEDGINGFLVPPREPKKLADAISKLASNRELREKMGKEGLRIAKTKFSLEIFHENISKIYSEVLASA